MSEWKDWNGGDKAPTELLGKNGSIRFRHDNEEWPVTPEDVEILYWDHKNSPGDIIAYRIIEEE